MASTLSSMSQELAGAARTLARRPGFAVFAAVLLALGLGAATSVVSVIVAVARQGVPFPEPDRLVLIQGTRERGGEREAMPISWLDLKDWRRALASRPTSPVERLAAYGDLQPFNLATGDGVEHVDGELATPDYFEALGITPIAGRLFAPDEQTVAGGRRVVLLGHDLWRRSFGARAEAVGSSVRVNGEGHEIVGVLPAGFRGLTDGAELWLPGVAAARVLAPPFLEQRRYRWLTAVARLRPGASLDGARAALEAATTALAREHPDTNTGVGATMTPLFDAWYGSLRQGLTYLAVGALLLLLIACGNVSGLLLAQAMARRRELTLRTALGAERGRIVAQLLAESLLLGLAGCALGLVLAFFATRALAGNPAAQFKSFVEVGLDPISVALALALALASVLFFGLVPALALSRLEAAEVLKEGARGSTTGRDRAQSLLVLAEVALALVLLVGAGLLVRGLSELRGSELGFRSGDLLTLRTYLDERSGEESAARALARELMRRLPGASGVSAAAIEGPGLPTDDWFGADYALESPGDTRGENKQLLLVHQVSAGYFELLGIPTLAGRSFSADDDERTAPVAIVSASFVERNFPGAPLARALGEGIRPFRDPQAEWTRIVGVVEEVRHRGLAAQTVPAPDVYFPLLQRPAFQPPTINLLVRPTAGTRAASLAPELRRLLREISTELPLYDVQTMAARLDRQTARPRFLAVLMSLFGAAALLLAGTGLYGLISHSVVRSTRAIGVRMALGASRREVLASVIGRAARLTLGGIAVGLTAALLLGRVAGALVGGVLAARRGSSLSLLAVLGLVGALSLLLTALVAAALPALRATRIQPVTALRSE